MTSPELAAGYTARDLSLHRAIQKHGPAYLLLVGLARALAFTAGLDGVTIADVREAARTNFADRPDVMAALEGRDSNRPRAWMGGLLKKAGLVSTDRIRRSHIQGTHGNRNVVHLHPDHLRRP